MVYDYSRECGPSICACAFESFESYDYDPATHLSRRYFCNFRFSSLHGWIPMFACWTCQFSSCSCSFIARLSPSSKVTGRAPLSTSFFCCWNDRPQRLAFSLAGPRTAEMERRSRCGPWIWRIRRSARTADRLWVDLRGFHRISSTKIGRWRVSTRKCSVFHPLPCHKN